MSHADTPRPRKTQADWGRLYSAGGGRVVAKRRTIERIEECHDRAFRGRPRRRVPACLRCSLARGPPCQFGTGRKEALNRGGWPCSCRTPARRLPGSVRRAWIATFGDPIIQHLVEIRRNSLSHDLSHQLHDPAVNIVGTRYNPIMHPGAISSISQESGLNEMSKMPRSFGLRNLQELEDVANA